MINKSISIIILLFIASPLTAQSIFPDGSNQFCPNVNINFTVTLPRITDNSTPSVVSWTNGPILVSGVSNLTNTPTQTTFTFIGKFVDINTNQAFKVNYSTSSNPNAIEYFEFKKIKSIILWHGMYSYSAKCFGNISSALPNCKYCH